MVEISPYSALSNLGSSTTDRASIAEDFDTFLTLLTTQLKNQSPLDPVKTNEFTQQLVQFTQVEQSVKQNANLEKLIQLSAANTITNVVGFLGGEVTVSGTTAQLSEGSAKWNYEIEGGSDDATFTILNSDGVPVYSTSGPAANGKNEFVWNGQTSTGSPAPNGDYSLSVTAVDSSGTALKVTTEIVGVVDGVDFSGDEPLLLIGSREVKLEDIISVKLPNTPSSLLGT